MFRHFLPTVGLDTAGEHRLLDQRIALVTKRQVALNLLNFVYFVYFVFKDFISGSP